jgi:dephospho-CoA kinase
MSAGEIKKREISQLPLEEKLRRADFVIDNDGSLLHTRKQVKAVWKKLSRELESR